MLIIHPAVDLSTGELLIASEIALNETLSNAPSMSRKVPKTYPFLAILRSMVCAILCNAVSRFGGGASLETELLLTKTVSHVVIMLHMPEDNLFLEFQQHW